MLEKSTENATWDDLDWGQSIEDEAVPPSVPDLRETTETIHVSAPLLESEAAQGARAQNKAVEGVQAPKKELSAASAIEPPKAAQERELPKEKEPASSAQERVVYAPEALARLTIWEKGEPTAIVPVKSALSIGRGEDNQLVILDMHVSTHHALLQPLADGRFELLDLNSTGGTFVNGQQIKKQIVKHQDRITFSTIHTVFEYLSASRMEQASGITKTIAPTRTAISPQQPSQAMEPNVATLAFENAPPQVLPSKERVSIGRNKDNDIVLTEPHISGSHAQIVRISNDAYRLIDTDSTCGTFLNGARIKSSDLTSGDKIIFGVLNCTFLLT